MKTAKQTAEGNIYELLEEAFSGARVFLSGGNKFLGNDLQKMMIEAADNALRRRYPKYPS